MADTKNSDDPLLDKLDNLMQSAHARKPHDPPPLLTDAVPDADDSAIPTLTDAVDAPEPTAKPEPEQEQEPEQKLAPELELEPIPTPEPGPHGEPDAKDQPDLRKLVSSRLVSAIDREMGKFAQELPVHRAKLAVLHRSLRFALPELVRLRWEDTTEQDTSTEDDETDSDR